jgi:hypothetical protein
MTKDRAPIVCRCGRMTRAWQRVGDQRLCQACAWEQDDDMIRPFTPNRVRAEDYVRPRWKVERVD